MTKSAWKKKIIKHCETIGTYRPEFETIYDMLSDTLAKIDVAQDTFDETGEDVIVRHTNIRGQTNWEQHPAIRLINELKRDALVYLRDCGLTAAALKKINDDELNSLKEKPSPLAEALAKLG